MSTQWCLSGCLTGCSHPEVSLVPWRADREEIPEDAINLDEVLDASINNASTLPELEEELQPLTRSAQAVDDARAPHWIGWISPPNVAAYEELDSVDHFENSGKAAFSLGWTSDYFPTILAKPMIYGKMGLTSVPSGKTRVGTLGGLKHFADFPRGPP